MEQKEIVFTRNTSGLVRELSWFDVFIMVIATPAASGILYFSVSTTSSYPGGNVPLAFIIGLILFLPLAAFIGIFSATMPRSGSLYVGVSRLIEPSIAYLGAILFFIGYGLTIGVLGYIVMGISGGILVAGGIAGKIDGLMKLGEALQTPFWETVGGFLWVILFWFITLRGLRAFRRTMRILFFIPLIATFIALTYFLITSPSSAAELFNKAWGEGVYEKILKTAKANGWGFPKFSWSQTIGLLLVVLWAYGGFEMIGYASGEIKSPKTSMIKGYIWGWLGVGFLYVILAFSVFKPFGDFIGAYDFLYNNHKEVLKEIMPLIKPSVPFYLQSIIHNLWIGIILAVALVFWFINTMPPFFLANSRLIFALAMDRAIPEKLADVNPYTNAPTWATHLTALFALLGVLLNAFDIKIVLGTINFSIWFVVWLYGLSAMLLPYKRPDIFDNSPVQWKIAGVPIVSLLGLVIFAEGWFFLFISVAELNYSIMLALIVIMIIGMILYLIKQVANKKKGVDIINIYTTIPPE